VEPAQPDGYQSARPAVPQRAGALNAASLVARRVGWESTGFTSAIGWQDLTRHNTPACEQRGVPVHGIELSRAMVARLRSKPGGEAIPVTIGDMTTARVDGAFTVAYLVYNTINNLTTQEAQVACFGHVAAHLIPGGCFVIETGIPNLRYLPPGQDILGYRAGPGGIVSVWEKPV
jgi:hypothetical protein